MTDPELLARRMPLPGTRNVRDVGGYTTSNGSWTRWGMLFRGDALHALDDAGRAQLAGYGLRTVIDLRTAAERAAYPDRLPPRVRVAAVPILDSLGGTSGKRVAAGGEGTARLPDLAGSYQFFVDKRGSRIARAIAELAQPGALPAIVHCMAGKDRTGVVIALVLSVLGVHDDVIASDYAATDIFLGAEYRAAAAARAAARGMDGTQFAGLLACRPELILDLLTYVNDIYGGADAYLAWHGLAQSDLDYLRIRLLSPHLAGQEKIDEGTRSPDESGNTRSMSSGS